MKKSILILMSVIFSYSVFANDLAPVPVQSSTPDQTWFYNLEDIVFDSDDSYVPNGYISYTKWYINGAYETGGSYRRSMSMCFALPGSPAGDCYQLASGQTTVQIKLEVASNHGYWEDKTITYTIQEHKGRKYFVKDHIGNVRTTVNRDGNVLGYDDYFPFGLVMPGRSNNTANPNDNYKFTGYEKDDEAGLTMYHANARGYDPVIGRFAQIDPLLEYSSPYTYVGNNPLAFTDPTGMASCGSNYVANCGDDGGIYATGSQKTVANKIYQQKQEIKRANMMRNTDGPKPKRRNAKTRKHNNQKSSSKTETEGSGLDVFNTLLISPAGISAQLLKAYYNQPTDVFKLNGKIYKMKFYGNKSISKYTVRAAKAGQLLNSSSLASKFSKLGSRTALLNAGLTLFDGINNGWENHHTADLVIAGSIATLTVAFPPAGLIVGGIYYASDFGTYVFTGKSITEHAFDK